ncbi:hypothetical protein [Methylobacterium nodulans]|uniref:Uncharacterized protein n=1 Tax=Methylobacterium nodulans (strain LMG 21967 / CNCM I-2342 / ORS 2060) TaxID=460265 RepID=B8IRR9_METNO|nr:hypothetical protein [Methylobacterium nodulans]ACL60619.1 hypothetical protein Mnod_5790 [Methylobacterium nodulans ORS 2060]
MNSRERIVEVSAAGHEIAEVAVNDVTQVGRTVLTVRDVGGVSQINLTAANIDRLVRQLVTARGLLAAEPAEA